MRSSAAAVLTRAADGEVLSGEEEVLLFRGLYILGGARDSQACQPLLRLLRRPPEEVERLLGDAVTEGLARITAGVFDGDVNSLFSIIADSSRDEFLRDALLGAATFLTWEGRIERDRMQSFLKRFYEERLAADDDFAWIAWQEAIDLLALPDLAPLVHSAWDQNRVPMGMLELSDCENDLLDAEQRPNDIGRFKRANLGYIDDVLEELASRISYAEDLDEEDPQSPLPDETWDAPWADATPAINPRRDVGRNDPCPCGSGKKFKKCCLAK
ncbi:DUF1186 domain-containing protein [Mesorhizobium sp. M00.F.Ca.ET.216.01.1.1]|uniref:DUF1186 domain-containing protein n=1 Tax=Mesorhizobium sp. M00.F.Ca.ET.216.01.1.1 TaxID=2500528 RepID=UPI0032AEAA5F